MSQIEVATVSRRRRVLTIIAIVLISLIIGSVATGLLIMAAYIIIAMTADNINPGGMGRVMIVVIPLGAIVGGITSPIGVLIGRAVGRRYGSASIGMLLGGSVAVAIPFVFSLLFLQEWFAEFLLWLGL